MSGPFHQIKLFPFLLWQRYELTAGSDEIKSTAQPRRGSNLGLAIAGWTLLPLKTSLSEKKRTEFDLIFSLLRTFQKRPALVPVVSDFFVCCVWTLFDGQSRAAARSASAEERAQRKGESRGRGGENWHSQWVHVEEKRTLRFFFSSLIRQF